MIARKINDKSADMDYHAVLHQNTELEATPGVKTCVSKILKNTVTTTALFHWKRLEHDQALGHLLLHLQVTLWDSKSTSSGVPCVFGSHTFVPISWMCKKQTAVSHSCESLRLFRTYGLTSKPTKGNFERHTLETVIPSHSHSDNSVCQHSQQFTLNPALLIRRQCGSDRNDQQSPSILHVTRTHRVDDRNRSANATFPSSTLRLKGTNCATDRDHGEWTLSAFFGSRQRVVSHGSLLGETWTKVVHVFAIDRRSRAQGKE